MDITFTDEQKLIAETAWSFAKNALSTERIRVLETDDNGFDADVWRQMVGMGWPGAVFPPEYGGSGSSLFELALIVEALGRGAVASPLFATVVEAGLLLLEAGSPAQCEYWLPRISDGRAILTAAIAEADGRFSPEDVRTAITQSGDALSVSGSKMFVRDAGVADAILCLGRSGAQPQDLSLVIIPAGVDGITRRRLTAAGGESLWELHFDNVGVAADAAVGTPGQAWPHVDMLIQRCAALKAAELVGIGQAALDLTVDYAKTRVQFGRTIGGLQSVHHHCTDMYRDIAVSRLLARQAAARLAARQPAAREAAMAKAKTSEAIPAVTRTAHQIHGAIAYYRDYPLELYYHRAIAGAAAYGDADYHRRSLACLLRNDVARFQGDHRHDLPLRFD